MQRKTKPPALALIKKPKAPSVKLTLAIIAITAYPFSARLRAVLKAFGCAATGAFFSISFSTPASAVIIQFGSSLIYNGREYRVYLDSSGPLSWSDARVFAQSLGSGADLASINDAAENAAIFGNLVSDQALWTINGNAQPTGPYIGLFQIAGSSEPASGWGWVDGNILAGGYSNWHPSQPDDYTRNTFPGSSIGDNVGLFFSLNGPASTWADTLDADTWGSGPNPFRSTSFVVEMQQSVTEVPGPLPILGAFAAFGYSRKLKKRIKGNETLPVASAIG